MSGDATGRARILIVDDNPTNVSILRELLAREYAVDVADTGEEALEQIACRVPDLVLLDVMMPGIDGYETCRRMRADPALEGVRIIMVTACAMEEERCEGLKAGADDYVTKPFSLRAIRERVRSMLAADEVLMQGTR